MSASRMRCSRARGLHASGELAVDANVGGTLADPRIRGSVTLANGSFRDYVRGVNLTHITAEIEGSQGTLQIKSFKASAASGTVSMARQRRRPATRHSRRHHADGRQCAAHREQHSHRESECRHPRHGQRARAAGRRRHDSRESGRDRHSRLVAAERRRARRAPARQGRAGRGQATGDRSRHLDQRAARSAGARPRTRCRARRDDLHIGGTAATRR